jgi:hypothetical protein
MTRRTSFSGITYRLLLCAKHTKGAAEIRGHATQRRSILSKLICYPHARGTAARATPVHLGPRGCPLAVVLDSSSSSPRQAGQIGCSGRSWRLGPLGCRPVCLRRGRWSGIGPDSVAQVAVQECQHRQEIEALEAIARKLRTLNGRVLDLSPEMRDLQHELERLR